jgi:hypothetical protein
MQKWFDSSFVEIFREEKDYYVKKNWILDFNFKKRKWVFFFIAKNGNGLILDFLCDFGKCNV